MSIGPGDALERLRSDPPRAGLFFDFDGTLSEIVERPELAVPLAGVPDALAALAARFGLVAVVTGRPGADLSRLLPVAGVRVFGLYGAEGEALPAITDDVRRRVAAVAAPVHGARVEDKGSSLAVHVREAPDPDAAEARLAAELRSLAAEVGLIVLPGRRVVELGPPGMGDKGRAVSTAAGELDLRAILYAGDDRADVGAFETLDRLRGSGVATVKIAVASSEAPDALLGGADLVVKGPTGLLDLLHGLIDGAAPTTA
jgi:trehalose 6-phosphate phosphatase